MEMMSLIEQKVVDLREIVGKGYGKFWKFKGRYRVVKGSRASKKSKTIALNYIMRMMEMPLANMVAIRNVAGTLKDSCFADLKWAARRLGVYHLWEFTTSPLEARYKNADGEVQKILFRGMDDPDKLASISVDYGYICFAWVEEAYEIEDEEAFDKLDDTLRGILPEGYFHQITISFNPWNESTWLKKKFFDADPDSDILAITTNYFCNEWLSPADHKRFELMKEKQPLRYRVAGLGEWGIEGGAVFEEWRNDSAHYKDRCWTHVIEPFEIPKDWRIYRSFDFGYAKPFSVGWQAVDHDGRAYRILEYYGCTGEPNTGIKITPDEIFKRIKQIESEHRWLKGKHIYGVADPSIWDVSRGQSIAETGEKQGIYFEPGDNKRMAGLMQCHYRLEFDDNGVPMFYVFSTCKDFIRTVPALKYDEHKAEDIDTDLEDHAYDDWRYFCMNRPMNPIPRKNPDAKPYNPLDADKLYDAYSFYRTM